MTLNLNNTYVYICIVIHMFGLEVVFYQNAQFGIYTRWLSLMTGTPLNLWGLESWFSFLFCFFPMQDALCCFLVQSWDTIGHPPCRRYSCFWDGKSRGKVSRGSPWFRFSAFFPLARVFLVHFDGTPEITDILSCFSFVSLTLTSFRCTWIVM